MNLEDDLAAAKKDRQREKCSVRVMLDDVDADTASKLEHAILDSQISPSKLSQVIEKHTGHSVADFSIRRHRRGMCKCPTTF